MEVYGCTRCLTDESKHDITRYKRKLKALGIIDEKNIY